MKSAPTLLSIAFWIAVYLGVGALCHVHFVGQVFLVDHMSSWGTLLAWPVVLLLICMKWIMIVVGAVLTLILVYIFVWHLTPLKGWMERRAAENIRKAVDRERQRRTMDGGGF